MVGLLNTIDLPQPPLKVLKSNEIVKRDPSSKIDVSKLLAPLSFRSGKWEAAV
jgi:hypothetical protein